MRGDLGLMTRTCSLLLVLTTSMQARCQEPPASRPASPLDGVKWLGGTPPAPGRITLIASAEAGAPDEVEAAERAAVLHTRFSGRGVDVALVIESKPGLDVARSRLARWSDVGVGVAPRGPARRDSMVALARDGGVCWRGALTVAAELVLEELLDGTFDARYWRRREELSADLGKALREADGPKLREIAGALRAIRPTTAEPWLLELVATAFVERNQDAAFALANSAAHALSKHPSELHRFVMAGLVAAAGDAEPQLREVAVQTLSLAVRQPAAPMELRVDHVAALLACGREDRAREAGAKLEADLLDGHAALAARLGLTLGTRKPPEASSKLAFFEKKTEPAVGHLAKVFNRLNREHDDQASAELVGRLLVLAWANDPSTLNSFGWRLSTEPETKERFPRLALLAGEAMTRCEEWEQPAYLDTLALELFEYGLVEPAIARQKEAMRTGGEGSDGGYPARLKRYEDARAARAATTRTSR